MLAFSGMHLRRNILREPYMFFLYGVLGIKKIGIYLSKMCDENTDTLYGGEKEVLGFLRTVNELHMTMQGRLLWNWFM